MNSDLQAETKPTVLNRDLYSIEQEPKRLLPLRQLAVEVEYTSKNFKHALGVPGHTRNHLITSYSLPRGLISSRKPNRMDSIDTF